MVGHDEHSRSGLFGSLFGGMRARREPEDGPGRAVAGASTPEDASASETSGGAAGSTVPGSARESAPAAVDETPAAAGEALAAGEAAPAAADQHTLDDADRPEGRAMPVHPDAVELSAAVVMPAAAEPAEVPAASAVAAPDPADDGRSDASAPAAAQQPRAEDTAAASPSSPAETTSHDAESEPAAPAEPEAPAALADISPFSPFSAPERPVTEPAAPAPVADVSLTFREPELPEPVEDAGAEPPAPAAEEPVRRRTRHRAARHPRPEEERSAEEPRRHPDHPVKVKGSTRLEAKKQRRNASRDAGRRRQSVTEVEFQARREAVDRQMIVRSTPDRIQIGVLEDGILVEHYAAHSKDLSLIGNVYLGRVQNVLPSMEAAFVDVGRGRNAVLYSGEVDWDAVEVKDKQRRIEMALKAGDTVLVQVTKDPVGHKGARLTSQISLPGRYLVYVPGGSMNGISRKLPDSERARLKRTLKEILPEGVGVIVRTAAEGATKEQLEQDVTRLQRQWEEIQRLKETQKAPALLHTEPNLLIKVIRDVFNEDITKLVVSGEDAEETIDKYLHTIAPDLVDRVEHYDGEKDIFDAYRVNEQLAKASERKVYLPSGGSLVIDRTEAMTVIDVNTGKFVGSGGNLEETVTKNNLEAAEEIVRQLRLRDLGGIVVVDFIDMVLESNRDLVLQRLIECLGRDRTKHQVAEVTSLGLIQMTRKKIGIGLAETFTQLAEGTSPDSGRGRGQSRRSRGRRTQQKPVKNTLNAEVKNAVAQVAASTIAHGAESTSAAGAERADAAPRETAEALTEPAAPEPRPPRPDAAAGSAAVSSAAAPASRAVSTAASSRPEPPRGVTGRATRPRRSGSRRASAPAGAPAPIPADGGLDLELPVPRHRSQSAQSIPDRDALLADVLARLPEGDRGPGEAGDRRE